MKLDCGQTVAALILVAGSQICGAGAAIESSTDPAPTSQEAARNVAAILKSRLPQLTVDSVSAWIVPGIFEVVTDDGISYTDATARHLFVGQMYDTESRKNLSLDRWNELNRIDFDSLPLDVAIKVVHGRGTRRVAVFADPECPYCQELEGQLAAMDDLTVYTFLFPLENIHPGATEMAQRLWCASDRAQAWTAWMTQKRPPPDGSCADTPLSMLAAFGEGKRIHTTPTIIFASGLRASGLPPKERLLQLLATEAAPATPSSTNSTPRATAGSLVR